MTAKRVMSAVTLAAVGFTFAGLAVAAGQQTGQTSASNGGSDKPDSRTEMRYDAAMQQVMPLSPKQIREYRERKQRVKGAMKDRKATELLSRTRRVSLEPGGTVETLEIVPGYVASVVVLDASGAPWPISSVTVGNQEQFTVKRPSKKEGHVIHIRAQQSFSQSNFAITLKGQALPLQINLRTIDPSDPAAQEVKQVQMQGVVVLRAGRRGPQAKEASIGPSSTADTISTDMIGFLDGVPPSEAVVMATKPQLRGVQVWRHEGHLYVRSRLPARWPAWDEVARGHGEIRVYRMPKSPNIIVAKGGKSQHLEIQGPSTANVTSAEGDS